MAIDNSPSDNDTPSSKALNPFEAELNKADDEEHYQQLLAQEELASQQVSIFDKPLTEEDMKFDLKQEVFSQIALLKAVRQYMFHPNGQPKLETESSDISAYMSNSMKLLTMLKSFEESLKTDDDLRRIELCIEMALEDSPCPEFVASLTTYLNDPDSY